MTTNASDASHNASPGLNKSSAGLPEVAGEWMMRIHWQRDGREGKVDATAIIEQENDRLSMEVYSEGSDSHTLLAQLGRDSSGSPVLHYIYQVEPKALKSDAASSYKGAAILRLYSDTGTLRGNYWTSQLSKGFFELSRTANGESCTSMTETVDVVLITAIEEEFDAAKKAFSAADSNADGVRAWSNSMNLASAPHEMGVFFSGGTPIFRIALAQSIRMGANRTGHLAIVLAEHLKPKCLVMCGVCAGNPKDLALGDIVVSELAYQYDEGKVGTEGFVGDHRQLPISDTWLRAASSLKAEQLPSYGAPTAADARYWILERLYGEADPQKHPARKRYFGPGQWAKTVAELEAQGLVSIRGRALELTDAGKVEVERSIVTDVDPPEALPLDIKIGPIASGNVVVKDGLTWGNLERYGVRSVLGLEMEAAAIGQVARASGISEWIVMKGVMDHADPNKDDRFKPFAARASAEALRIFLVGRFSELAHVASTAEDRRFAPAEVPKTEDRLRPLPRKQSAVFQEIEASEKVPPTPAPDLSDYEKGRKLPIVDEAIAILNHNAVFEQPIDEAGRFIDTIEPQIKAGNHLELVEALKGLRLRFKENNQRIGALYMRVENIHDDLAKLFEQPYQDALFEGIDRLSNALKKMRDDSILKPDWIVPELEKFKAGRNATGQWRTNTLFALFDLRRSFIRKEGSTE